MKTGKNFGLLSLPVSKNLVDTLLWSDEIRQAGLYQPVLINDMLPSDPMQRHQALRRIKEHGYMTPTCLFSQTHTGSVVNMHFLWKTEETVDQTKQAQAIQIVQDKLPQYHTRAMRQDFLLACSKLSVNPMHAQNLYAIATDDSSASTNAATAAIDQRVMDFVQLEDPDIIMDLRTVNEVSSKFDEFFEKTKEVIEETIGHAVDERRHDVVTHLATATSAAALYRCGKLGSYDV